ncbi:unnamed protein product [Angiostrongylus costaricensis]|uniref:G_PROTEIN_RECEP_F1_2 domain-containing protein n=1 Tax=Angiostrongylus costaricensis TaxID=334426 RepID=A0A158PEW0_ANGCS|nr:unnamed protein product [Angiostrongylus costaricensis]
MRKKSNIAADYSEKLKLLANVVEKTQHRQEMKVSLWKCGADVKFLDLKYNGEDAVWGISDVALLLLIIVVVLGNTVVILVVLVDRKLKAVTTNKFIASLAVSDLLVGVIVMPMSLYSKLHGDNWTLGYTWCQFHLVSGVFSSTASIVHLVLRNNVPNGVSTTLRVDVHTTIFGYDLGDGVLSSLLSFFLPGAIVVYLYTKIFRKLRNHQLFMFGQSVHKHTDKRQSLPRVIIEEVRSRRGSRLSQNGSPSGCSTRRSSGSKGRSPSQPDIHSISMPQQRWRSPTICAETLAYDRNVAAKKRVSIVPDPPSMDISVNIVRKEELNIEADPLRNKTVEPKRKLDDEPKVKAVERQKLSMQEDSNGLEIMQAFEKVPRLFECPSLCSVPSLSSHSSHTSASSGDTLRRISTNSYGSSLTDNSDSTFEIDSRRSSAWSTLRNAVLEAGHVHKTPIDITIDGSNETPQKKISTISRGKLRRIATQVTRAIRRKRRESMAIRRESRATRVVAAILSESAKIAFLICWIPYFCVSVTRGIAMGFSIQINHHLHLKLYVLTSWLGYTHSCFNPVIYMCLNTSFRATMRFWIHRTRKGE